VRDCDHDTIVAPQLSWVIGCIHGCVVASAIVGVIEVGIMVHVAFGFTILYRRLQWGVRILTPADENINDIREVKQHYFVIVV
jgi:hypothetical protein